MLDYYSADKVKTIVDKKDKSGEFLKGAELPDDPEERSYYIRVELSGTTRALNREEAALEGKAHISNDEREASHVRDQLLTDSSLAQKR
eukprot:3915551-Alexandrium_andersonii.AAC.1